MVEEGEWRVKLTIVRERGVEDFEMMVREEGILEGRRERGRESIS